MKLVDLCVSLPDEVRIAMRPQKRRKRMRDIRRSEASAMLDPLEIGIERVKAMIGVPYKSFSDEELVRIGRCALDKQSIIVGYNYKRELVILEDSKSNRAKYRNHAWLVHGRKVIRLGRSSKIGTAEELMDAFESEDLAKPLSVAKSGDIFEQGMSRGRRKKSSGGCYMPNRPLTRMSMSNKSIEGNKVSNWGIIIR